MALTFKERFPKPALFVVIHLESEEQGESEFLKTYESGVDGVFFISHGKVDADEQTNLCYWIKKDYPDAWIGANWLGDVSDYVFKAALHANLDGVWRDNSYVSETDPLQLEAKRILNSKIDSKWKGLYFGGVAFKTQATPKNLSKIVKDAIPYMDVITTSGPGTGRAADVEKIKIIRESIGPDVPMVIASGVTPDNAKSYLPHADGFLVATGVSKSFYELDSKLITKLVKAIK